MWDDAESPSFRFVSFRLTQAPLTHGSVKCRTQIPPGGQLARAPALEQGVVALFGSEVEVCQSPLFVWDMWGDAKVWNFYGIGAFASGTRALSPTRRPSRCPPAALYEPPPHLHGACSCSGLRSFEGRLGCAKPLNDSVFRLTHHVLRFLDCAAM